MSPLRAYACVLVALACAALPGVGMAALTPQPEGEDPWVLQMGYFASIDNALAYQHDLAARGIEAETLAEGVTEPRHYRVIAGRAGRREDLLALQQQVGDVTGETGYIRELATQTEAVDLAESTQEVEEELTEPKKVLLLAQATPRPSGGESIGSNPMHGQAPGSLRTPQGELPSSAGITAGGLQIIPTLGASIGYDDNITAAPRDEISSWFYMISPAIRVELPSDHSVLALTAALDMVRYEDSPIDDSDNWYLRADYAWDISTRQDVSLYGQYSEGADERGTGRTQGETGLLPLEPDEWERIDLGGIWSYGAVGTRGRLTLMGGMSELDYSNNREGTAPGDPGTTALDRDWWFLGGTFYVRVAPKTSLLAEYVHTDISYDFDTGLDSTEDSFMLGATWDATARTSGTLKYGVLEKDFADPERESYDGPAWAASVSWRPRTYSMFTLTGTRNTQEPDGGGNYVLREDVFLSWLHDWATRFGTFVDIGFGWDDYRPTGRTDELFFWGVGARYAFNQHFRFGASIRYYQRDSDIDQFNYEQMVYLLTLEANF